MVVAGRERSMMKIPPCVRGKERSAWKDLTEEEIEGGSGGLFIPAAYGP